MTKAIIQTLSAETFHQALETKGHNPKVKFIDVRTPAEYKNCHIAGVVNLPIDKIQNNLDTFKNTKEIYIQCAGGGRSTKASEILKETTADIFDFCGGLTHWEKQGYPVIKKKGSIPIIQQVMIIAGALVLLGVLAQILGYFYGIYLVIFISAGMLFSGISGWCGMTSLLEKMPWNR